MSVSSRLCLLTAHSCILVTSVRAGPAEPGLGAQERYDLHSYRSELTVIQNTTTGSTVLVSRGDSYGDQPNPGACETRTYPPDFNSTTCALAPSLRLHSCMRCALCRHAHVFQRPQGDAAHVLLDCLM